MRGLTGRGLWLSSVYGDEVDENKAVQCSLIVSHQCLLRNKRCLLAYLYVS